MSEYNDYYGQQNVKNNGELGWEDEVNDDFIELPPGTYQFTVKNLIRARHSGADWMPPCNKADVVLSIIDPQTGTPVTVKDSLYLHEKGKWKICKFFESVGMKKKGEPLRMNWNVLGKTGMCEIIQREGTRGGKFANVKQYLPAEDARPVNEAPAAPSWKSGTF